MNATKDARRWRRRLLLLGTAAFVALVCAEIAARVALAVLNSMPPKAPTADHDVLLVELLQQAEDPDIVYELQPDLDCRFQGVAVHTDSHGNRGPEQSVEKPANGFRILGLGDSVLFGWGVERAQCGLADLERRLAARLPGRAVSTINTGVPGYNTAMQAAVLRSKGVAWKPDVVLLDFVGNDLELPNFLRAPANFWRLDHCYLRDLALRAWRSSWLDPRTPFVWAPGDGAGHFESDPALVPPEYRHLVGLDGFRRGLESILATAKAHGFRVLVTSHHDLPAEVAAIVAATGAATVSVGPRVRSWLAANHVRSYLGSELTLSATDPHPTPMLHDWWAEAVFAKLDELGWLPE